MNKLLNEVRRHTPADTMEELHVSYILGLIEDQNERSFFRDCFHPGHITGSALLVSCNGERVLLNHHKSLNKWLCFGGHADGETNILAVAIRETIEESGISNIKPFVDGIVDVDVHQIPRNSIKQEPIHFHYDIRYILQCNDQEHFYLSDESNDLRWSTFAEAMDLITDVTMCRLLTKWKNFQ